MALFETKTAYGSLCQGNATYAYVNGQYPRTDKNLGPGSDCSYEIWSILIASKTSFNNELVDDIWVVMVG